MKDQQGASRNRRAATSVLIYPKTGIDLAGVSVFAPLGMISLAAALRAQGHQVAIVDMRTDSRWRRTLADLVRAGPLFVGISAMTGAQISWGTKAAGVVRSIDSGVPVLWGGVHPTILPEQTLADPLVDAVIAGTGEQVLLDLVERLARGEQESVVGAVHRAKGEADAGQGRVLAGTADPEVDWSSYVMPIAEQVRGLVHVTSRGCPHRCAYCYLSPAGLGKWQADPAEAVLEDLERISALGVQGILLFDDNFFVNRQRVEQIAHGLVRRGSKLVIKADCRADYLARYDDEFLELVKRAGFCVLYVGAESGADRVLEQMDKGVTVAELRRANQRLARVGIQPHYSFMAGLPGERIEEMRATVDLMRSLKKQHPGAYLSPVKSYVPYPGTRMYDQACAAGFEPFESLLGWSKLDWDGRRRPWLSRAESRFLEKVTYVTAGLDHQVAALSGLDSGGLKGRSFQFFSRLCQKRCARPNLGLVPELPLVRIVRRLAL